MPGSFLNMQKGRTDGGLYLSFIASSPADDGALLLLMKGLVQRFLGFPASLATSFLAAHQILEMLPVYGT